VFNPTADRVLMASLGKLADGPELFADIRPRSPIYVNGALERSMELPGTRAPTSFAAIGAAFKNLASMW
jgi:hypothetical protein